MNDFFAVGEEGAMEVSSWAKAALMAAGICVALWSVIDVSDSLSSATPGFAVSQWIRLASGKGSEGEREARALLYQAARESGLPALASVRVWSSDKMERGSANGMFNPLVYKITLGERFATAADYDQRWLVFHEAGHAAQLLTSRIEPIALPGWGLSAKTAKAMSSSLLYRQAYAESFADVFALAMAMRLDPADPRASSELVSAQRGALDSLSIAHDTQPALRIASGMLAELTSARGEHLLSLIDAIAIQGAARSVGEWGAEREALCLEGLWGWERWAGDLAHEVASNPWSMAAPSVPAQGEAWGSEIAELMALTRGPRWGAKREAILEGAWAGYQHRLSGATRGSGPGMGQAGAWGEALADYEASSRSSVRGLLGLPLHALAALVEAPRPKGCLSR